MILSKGNVIVKDKNKKTSEQYIMRMLEKRELPQLMELQSLVYDNLPNKQVLVTDTQDEILEDMEYGAKVIGVFNPKGQLISYRYFSFPNQREKNMGKYVGVDEAELPNVVHLETTIVHPKYRGNDLQNLTLKQAVKLSENLGYQHLICTVSPFNFYSLYNIMKNGLKIKSLKKMYGQQYLRFILHKDMKNPMCFSPVDIVRSKFDDISSNHSLIAGGYIGSGLSRESKDIDFMRPTGCEFNIA